MDIGTLPFFIFCAGAISIWMLASENQKLSPYFLMAFNVCFAGLAAGSLQALLPIAAFILLGYALLILLDRAVIRKPPPKAAFRKFRFSSNLL